MHVFRSIGYSKTVASFCIRAVFLQHVAKLTLQALYCICYGKSVRPSVRHTPVLCQNEGTQKDAVFTSRSPVSLDFGCQELTMGDDPVQIKLSAKRSTPVKTAELYTFCLITPEPYIIDSEKVQLT